MTPRPRHLAPLLAALLFAGGCVQRTITIESEPSGALVHLNDVEVGRTPLEVPFQFYGVYDVRLAKEGYETLHTATEAAPPWWDYPGPDLIAEVLPGRRHVDLNWHYELKPDRPVRPEELIERARQLRSRFQSGEPDERNGATKEGGEGMEGEKPGVGL